MAYEAGRLVVRRKNLFTKYNVREIPISSMDYPKEWRGLQDAPPTLYAVGNIALLKRKKLVVVGSRRTPVPALRLGENIAKELSHTLVIVTGTADGGDTAAIEGALKGSGNVVCLLAGGFSSISPMQTQLLERVAEKGLVISPHPYETTVRNFSYDYRNKLLSLLGEGVFVLGAGEKSGALITARYAWGQQKPLFAIPYFPGSMAGEGCNAILRAGGTLVETAQDVAEKLEINLEEEEKREVPLTADEKRLILVLKELAEGHVMELASATGMPAFKVKGILSALEVKGVVVAVGGNRYKPL